MNPDQLSMLDPAVSALVAFRVIDAVQSDTPATQVGAISTLFLLLCEHYRVDPRDALALGDRLLMDKDHTRTEHANALREYITRELAR